MHLSSHECNNAQHAATHMHLQRGAGGCYIATRHFAVQCHTLQHAATRCSKQAPAAPSGRLLYCHTTLCNTLSTLQHTATHMHLQSGAGSFDTAPQTRCNALQHAATRCNTYVSVKRSGWLLYCNTTHCNTLQRTSTQCNTCGAERGAALLRHTTLHQDETHCNTRAPAKRSRRLLHCKSTHCNTLQHTAPHCNTLARAERYEMQL